MEVLFSLRQIPCQGPGRILRVLARVGRNRPWRRPVLIPGWRRRARDHRRLVDVGHRSPSPPTAGPTADPSVTARSTPYELLVSWSGGSTNSTMTRCRSTPRPRRRRQRPAAARFLERHRVGGHRPGAVLGVAHRTGLRRRQRQAARPPPHRSGRSRVGALRAVDVAVAHRRPQNLARGRRRHRVAVASTSSGSRCPRCARTRSVP